MVTCDPEVRIVPRQANDEFIVLACDGIWDCMTSEDCVWYMHICLKKKKAHEPITQIIETLFDRLIPRDLASSDGSGTDNMTCCVVQLKNTLDTDQ